MVKLQIYMNFTGNTEEAFNFYKSVFGGQFKNVTRFKDMPMPGMKFTTQEGNKIMNMTLPIGENDLLMGSDVLESNRRELVMGNDMQITIIPDSKDEATRIFKALSSGGKVDMKLGDQVWGDYYGSFKDKFGVSWMVDYAYKPGEKKAEPAGMKSAKTF
jgi:PhnB protein